MQLNKYEEQLKEQYRALHNKRKPDLHIWHQTKPAIPFVGDRFGKEGRVKVLVYGSAENLNWKFPADMPFHRNREAFNRWKAKDFGVNISSIDNWFPWVHMTPVSDGTLLTTARYLLELFDQPGFSTDPGEFLSEVAIGNYSKFSLRSGRDPAGVPEFLIVSDDHVLQDLHILQPDVVVLPRRIHANRFFHLRDRSAHKPKLILGIYQTNAQVINRTIRPQLAKGGLERPSLRYGWQKHWLSHIPPKVRMDYYLDWLDWRCGKRPDLNRPKWTIRHDHG